MSIWSAIKKQLTGNRSIARRDPIIDVSDPEQIARYRGVLEEMVSLLDEHGFKEEAAVVREIKSYLKTDGQEFARFVTGPGIWGNLGFEGAAGCNVVAKAPFGSVDAFKQQRRLEELLINLAELLKADGMFNPKIDSLAEYYMENMGHAVRPRTSQFRSPN